MDPYADRAWQGTALLVIVVGCVLTAVFGWMKKENAAPRQASFDAMIGRATAAPAAPKLAPVEGSARGDTTTRAVREHVAAATRTPEARHKAHTGQNAASASTGARTVLRLDEGGKIAETGR